MNTHETPARPPLAELLGHVAQATAEMSPDEFKCLIAWTTADMTVLADRIAELTKTIGEHECALAEFTGLCDASDDQRFDLMMTVARQLKQTDEECFQRQQARIAELEAELSQTKGGA